MERYYKSEQLEFDEYGLAGMEVMSDGFLVDYLHWSHYAKQCSSCMLKIIERKLREQRPPAQGLEPKE